MGEFFGGLRPPKNSKKMLGKDKGPCDCLPTWLLKKIPPVCIHCSNTFDEGELIYLFHWLYPCSDVTGRTHLCSVVLHDKCTLKYHKFMEDNGYRRFVDTCFTHLDDMPLELAKELTSICLDNHHPLNSRCGNCRVVKQKETKFFKCSCKAIRYCCKMCQKMDWERHSKTCTFISLYHKK